MQTHHHIFSSIASFDALLAAYRRARRAGRICPGATGFDFDLESNLIDFPGDDLFALLRPRGLPIGNLTSQFFANVFLDPTDHFIKEQIRVRGYVRYADDIRVFHDSKRELHRIRGEIEGFLAQRRLVLHERKTSVTPCSNGVPFLGFVLYPGDQRKLSRDGVRRFRRRLRRAASDLESGRITPSDLTR